MNDIPTYQIIVLLVLLFIICEIIFENVFKLRSKIQKHFKNKIVYMTFSIIFVYIISLLIDFFLVDSRYYKYFNIVIIAMLIFLMDLSYYKKGR